MLQLPPALAAMAAYRQFIACQFVPDPETPGKTFKYPVSPFTGARVDAHDPAHWADHVTACAAASARGGVGAGWGVGFVFTERDPFFFIDVDDCAVAGPDGAQTGWTPIVAELVGALPGAAVEISNSGRGLHIFGTGSAPTDRRKKDHTGKLFDLYTERRFVALTGTAAYGDAGTDHTAALHALVERHMKRDATAGPIEWTDGPCEGWRGPADDAALIERAMASRSTAAAFGARASFADLWAADVDALARAYPHDQGTAAYDASSADAALAQHLAFWTGKDCTRIERLMRRSALARPKWDERDDYLAERTIMGAVGRQVDVLADREPEPAAVAPAPAESTLQRGRLVTGSTFLSLEDQITTFAGCVYITELHRVLIPNGLLIKPEQFKVAYGGYTMTMDPGNERQTRCSWDAFTQSQGWRAPRADGICFKPKLPAGAIVTDAGRTRSNTWWPVDVPRKVGDPAPFLRHLAKVLPNERDRTILLSYMAACVQHVGTKFQWAPLVQGVEGNGKTLFTRCVAEAVGRRYTHWPKASQLATPFNAWLLGNVFFGVEDIFIPGDKGEIFEELKPMITGDQLEIQGKGVDQTSADVCGNFIFNSNHKDGVRKTAHDRRLCVMYSAQQEASHLERDGMSGRYFPELYDWLRADGYAIVSELLHTYAIPDEFNPAGACQRAPITTSTDAAIDAGRGSVEQEVQEAIDQGLPGFAGGWVSSMMLKTLLSDLRATQKIPINKRDELMASLGYVVHPGLPGGRVYNPVLPDAGRPRLYILSGHPSAALTGAAVAHAYSTAQGPAPLVPAGR